MIHIKCKCWIEYKQIVGWKDANTPIYGNVQYRCNGTKERELCKCNGEELNCDFYPEKRKKALLNLKNKISNFQSVYKELKPLILWRNDFVNKRDWETLCEALELSKDTNEIELKVLVINNFNK